MNGQPGAAAAAAAKGKMMIAEEEEGHCPVPAQNSHSRRTPTGDRLPGTAVGSDDKELHFVPKDPVSEDYFPDLRMERNWYQKMDANDHPPYHDDSNELTNDEGNCHDGRPAK
jgi:hypothetical protein